MTASLDRRAAKWRKEAVEFTSLAMAVDEARRQERMIYAAVRGWIYRVYPGGRTVQLVLR